MDEQTNQSSGLNISSEKMFQKIGRLDVINDELQEMLANTKKKLQEVVDENDKLKKQIESLKAGVSNLKMKVVSEN